MSNVLVPEYLTIGEVAELLRVNTSTISRWIAEGKFAAPVKLGGATQRFSRSTVQAFLDKQQSSDPFAARNPKPKRAPGGRK